MKEVDFYIVILKSVASLILVVCLLYLTPAWGQTGGNYKLTWSTIDGGGGTSTGGPYALMATTGQPDAAWSRGGQCELLGGFWPGGPLCVVNFESFAKFAELWSVTGSDLPADLYPI